jgi:hypothetical protein
MDEPQTGLTGVDDDFVDPSVYDRASYRLYMDLSHPEFSILSANETIAQAVRGYNDALAQWLPRPGT